MIDEPKLRYSKSLQRFIHSHSPRRIPITRKRLMESSARYIDNINSPGELLLGNRYGYYIAQDKGQFQIIYEWKLDGAYVQYTAWLKGLIGSGGSNHDIGAIIEALGYQPVVRVLLKEPVVVMPGYDPTWYSAVWPEGDYICFLSEARKIQKAFNQALEGNIKKAQQRLPKR